MSRSPHPRAWSSHTRLRRKSPFESMCMIALANDGLFEPDGVRSSFEKLAACYRKAGIPERLRTRLYEAPHEFNADMQAEAWAWLKKWV